MSGGRSGFTRAPAGRGRMIEGEILATSSGGASSFKPGDRVFHEKFGYGDITELDGNKATVLFDKTGEKRVLDSFLKAA